MTLTVEQIENNYLHVWWLVKETNPKTRRFWSSFSWWMVVFDSAQIVTQLELAKQAIADAKKENKEILLVCEKALYADDVARLATSAGCNYMNYKFPAGFLTNFDTLATRIQAMNEKRKFIESEEFHKVTKKEQITIKKQLAKIEQVYGWVKNLKKRPEFVIVVDWVLMASLAKEIDITGVDSVVLASSNFNKRWKWSLVVMNMQSYKSVAFALQYLLS